jgi:hypothetical protein
MITRERCAREDRNDRVALLTGGLNVSFKAPNSCAELIVVAGLDAPNHAVEVLGVRGSGDRAQTESGHFLD